MKNDKTEPIPVMDYRQYRRARRLVHECCNYIDGNCIALDDGEECVCVQSISYSLLCRWFRAAVLPQDKELETALFHRMNAKKCAVCGALFTPGSNRAKYCPECAARMKRINAAKRKRKQREKCHALNHAFDEPKQWEIREINEIMNQCIDRWRYFPNPRMFSEYGRQKGWERENPATDSGNPSEKTMDGFVEVTEQMELPF